MTDLTHEGLRARAKVLALALEPIWPGLPRLYADWADEASPKIERAFITIVAEVDKLHEEALAGLLRLRVAEARRAQWEADIKATSLTDEQWRRITQIHELVKQEGDARCEAAFDDLIGALGALRAGGDRREAL